MKKLMQFLLKHSNNAAPLSASLDQSNVQADTPLLFGTYEGAVQACENNGYENIDLVKVVVDKNIIFKKNLQFMPVFDLGALRTLIAIGLSKNNEAINVIDFGGGGGYHHTIASVALGNSTVLNWNVVETSAMASEGIRIENNGLKFFDSLDKAQKHLGSVDLILASSVLQYCPSPLKTLRQLTEVDSKYLFVTRTPFMDLEGELVTIQTSKLSENGPGPLPPQYTDGIVTYPTTYVSKLDVEKILNERYRIKFKIVEDKGVFKVDGKEVNMYGYFCERRI